MGHKFSANWKSENYLYFMFRDEFTQLSEQALSVERGKLLPESEKELEQRAYGSHDQEEEVGSAKVQQESEEGNHTSGIALDIQSNSDRLFEHKVSKDITGILLLSCGFSTPVNKRGRLESQELESLLKELVQDESGFVSLKTMFNALCEIQ